MKMGTHGGATGRGSLTSYTIADKSLIANLVELKGEKSCTMAPYTTACFVKQRPKGADNQRQNGKLFGPARASGTREKKVNGGLGWAAGEKGDGAEAESQSWSVKLSEGGKKRQGEKGNQLK